MTAATEIVIAGLAETFGLPLQLVQPLLLEIHHRGAERHDHQSHRLVVGDRSSRSLPDDVLDCERPGLVASSISRASRSSIPLMLLPLLVRTHQT
jgi:hypothetical protein